MGRHICNGLGVHDARVDWPHSDVAVVGGLAYSLRALKKLPDVGWKASARWGPQNELQHWSHYATDCPALQPPNGAWRYGATEAGFRAVCG